MADTGISPLWRKLATSWLGNSDGVHCHWCEFILTEDGEATCNNPSSPFFDGDRIRTWDGEFCATHCPLFALDKWYKDDRNYRETFGLS